MAASLEAIVGPTASGKTALALQRAAAAHGEIISVDSRQIYRDLSIGTAKPNGVWNSRTGMYDVDGIACHLVDFLDPRRAYSAADFAADAHRLIKEISARGRTPILAGGTGFYFKALENGLAPLPPADPQVRQRLRAEAESSGREALHARLAQADSEAAGRIPANNIQRVIRALEVFELTGKPLSVWHAEHRQRGRAPTVSIRYTGLDPGPEELRRRIERRAGAMFEQGLVEETRRLIAQGCPENAPAFNGLGYPRVIAHLRGEISVEEARRLLIQDTLQYAKRQRTWFRHQTEVTWKTS